MSNQEWWSHISLHLEFGNIIKPEAAWTAVLSQYGLHTVFVYLLQQHPKHQKCCRASASITAASLGCISCPQMEPEEGMSNAPWIDSWDYK